MKDLNQRPKCIKLLEVNIQEKLSDIAFTNDLSDITQKSQVTK